jgi:rhodanese-related sulfurtransferase
MSRLTVDDLLERARAGLSRVSPQDASAAMRSGDAVVIDIRADSQIAADGTVPGAVRIARNVLEWRLDPACEYRAVDGPGLEEQVIVMCDAGYQSSLAAATLQELGFTRATDLVGGFQAWREAGLPVVAGSGGAQVTPGGSDPDPRAARPPAPGSPPD